MIKIPPYAEMAPSTQKLPAYHLKELLAALAIKESSCNPDAINEQEEAWGLYQIRPIYLKDVNQILEKDNTPWFTHKDCFDPATAALIVTIYLNHYGYYDRLRPESHDHWIEMLAAIHNGGPNGHKKQATKKYREDIMNIVRKSHKTNGT